MTGTVTLSIEIELGWGFHDLEPRGIFSPDRSAETTALRRLLARCEEFDIPITFNIVGSLFHDRWQGEYESPHASGWFDDIPRTDVETDPLYYAPDLVDAIQDTNVDHEICTHTFSHTPCAQVDPEVVAWEMDQAHETHRRSDVAPSVSLVPPRHSEPPRDVLVDAGIEIVRLSVPDRTPTKVHKFKELLFEPLPPREPRIVDGVVETYCTSYPSLSSMALPKGQKPAHPVFRLIPRQVRKRLHERSLARSVEAASTADSYTHIWCHLHNLANDDQWEPVHSFLETLAASRDRDDVEILTMRELNEKVRSERGESTDREAEPDDRGRSQLEVDGGRRLEGKE